MTFKKLKTLKNVGYFQYWDIMSQSGLPFCKMNMGLFDKVQRNVSNLVKEVRDVIYKRYTYPP